MAPRRPARRQTPTSKPLSEREHRFVRAYVGPAAGNGTEAARLAGYKGSPKAMGVTAVRLLARASVQQAIARLRQQADRQAAMTLAELQERWARIFAGAEPGSGKLAMRDRLKASELLARSMGAFVERREHTFRGPVRVIHEHRDGA